MEILLLNLKRSEDRLEAMKKAFGDIFTKIEAVDGFDWQGSDIGFKGRPLFKESFKKQFIEDGFLSFRRLHPMTPCELAIIQSHKKAWQYIIDKKLDGAWICEDDIKPAKKFKGFDKVKVPSKSDVFFIGGNYEKDEAGNIVGGQANYCYYITKDGAKKSLEIMQTAYLVLDIQWWSLANPCHYLYRRINEAIAYEGDTLMMKAHKDKLVIESKTAESTTTTLDGQKPWVKKD